jgi:hypothetical protein
MHGCAEAQGLLQAVLLETVLLETVLLETVLLEKLTGVGMA